MKEKFKKFRLGVLNERKNSIKKFFLSIKKSGRLIVFKLLEENFARRACDTKRSITAIVRGTSRQVRKIFFKQYLPRRAVSQPIDVTKCVAGTADTPNLNFLNFSFKTRRAGGFLFIILLITLSLISVVLLFLASASNTMMFQANNVYLQACERNLVSSGLNWARVKGRDAAVPDANDTIQLDTSKMGILHSSLEIKFTNTKNEQPEVQIKTTCGKARLTLNSSNSFKIQQQL